MSVGLWSMGLALVPVCAALACPAAPVRPVCIPYVGEFDDAREMERCGREVQAYAKAMEPVFRCTKDAQRQAALRDAVKSMKEDFEDAADGLMANLPGRPGVPPSPPDVGGGAAGEGVQTSPGVQTQVYVNADEGGSGGTSPGTPGMPGGPWGGRR